MANLRSEIEQLTPSVFAAVAGAETFPCRDPFPTAADDLVGVIYLAGHWRGAVVLHLPRAVATPVAAEMLGLAMANVGEESLRQATGDLTSRLGDCLKRTLDTPAALSLPQVCEGAGSSAALLSTVAEEIVFLSSYGPFGVCVYT